MKHLSRPPFQVRIDGPTLSSRPPPLRKSPKVFLAQLLRITPFAGLTFSCLLPEIPVLQLQRLELSQIGPPLRAQCFENAKRQRNWPRSTLTILSAQKCLKYRSVKASGSSFWSQGIQYSRNAARRNPNRQLNSMSTTPRRYFVARRLSRKCSPGCPRRT